ncbi:MAG TPA: hypothetical protein VKG02_22960 [Blastocatellia bacterium]|nr:hypothetical protein [Blastocatellia bacterium]
MFKGAIHLHSVYSDGEFTLAELREALDAAGRSFACMTDHAEYFDRLMTRDYVAECASLSDDRFRFIPGFESDGRLPVSLLASFKAARALSDHMRRAAKVIKRALKRCGVNVPAPLKSQLRRIF